jgi:membrane protease YdiL (CAAX protease family)
MEILAPPDIPEDIIFPGVAAVFTYEALALWTPFTEEVFFRGFVLAGLVPRLGAGRAMVASALIFSAFHVSIGLIVPIFITGLLLAWLYHRTGSLWASVAAHAGQNTLAITLTSFGV